MTLPPAPFTFTEFPGRITGPSAEVSRSGQPVDGEAEPVAVIGSIVPVPTSV